MQVGVTSSVMRTLVVSSTRSSLALARGGGLQGGHTISKTKCPPGGRTQRDTRGPSGGRRISKTEVPSGG
jgi:hypothetical protein